MQKMKLVKDLALSFLIAAFVGTAAFFLMEFFPDLMLKALGRANPLDGTSIVLGSVSFFVSFIELSRHGV